MEFDLLTTITNETYLLVPVSSGQVVRFNGERIVTTANYTVQLQGTGPILINKGSKWKARARVGGTYNGHYFDGDSPNYLKDGNSWFPKTDYPMTLTDIQRRYFLHEGNNVTTFSLPPNSSQKVKLSGSGDVVIAYRKKYL